MPLLRTLVFSLALAPLSLAACTDDTGGESAGPEVDCAEKAVPKYSEMQSIWDKCTICHSSTITDPAARMAAPIGFNYDTYDAAKATAMQAANEVEEGEMPRPPAPAMTADEKDQLYRWAACGTPN
jgi:uncharacterized membrane protein